MRWNFLFMVLLVVLFLSVSLFGLTEEEKEILPELSKETLIKIILEYEKGLNEAKENLIKQGILIQDLEISIETLSAELKLQKALFLESLQMQAELARKNLIDKILIGSGSFLAGNLSGYLFF